MKKILITGKNSYVGNSFLSWIENKFPNEFKIDTVGMKNGEWEKKSFEGYDSIIHVAGIAHVSNNKNMEDLYYEVNTELTFKVAEKAKKENVSQFIFLSSMIVFGDANNIQEITAATSPKPSNFYGDSKLQAEKKLEGIETDQFNVAIIRPPMIYGKNSKGNYRKLSKISKLTPIFPDYRNKRSMIFIENLNELIRLIILNNEKGKFHPQNSEYVCTTDLVEQISLVNNKKMRKTSIYNPIIKLLISKVSVFNKLFGNFFYSKEISNYKHNYNKTDFKDSIQKTEEAEK